MIVVDSSALVAISQMEPDWTSHLETLRQAGGAWISPINYVECGMVLIQRGQFPGQDAYDAWLKDLGVQVDLTADVASIALSAFVDYGKGRNPAGLNLGDCFSYALAQARDLPLLYKGDDFPRTDIRPAIVPTTP